MRGMRWCFCNRLAGAFLLPMAVSLAAQTAPAAKTESPGVAPTKFAAEVPLLDCDGVPCIEARIGEGKPLKLGIDTGNVSSVVDKDVADAAGLKPTKAMPAGAPAGVFITVIATVHIGRASGAVATGEVTLREVPALGLSLSDLIGQKQMPDVAGKIGRASCRER